MLQNNDAKIVQLAQFFIEKYNYVTLNVNNNQLGLWLFSADNANYSLLRITTASLNRMVYEKDAINQIVVALNKQFNLTHSFLDIHIGQDEVFDTEEFDTVSIDQDYYSGIDLTGIYPGIKDVIHPVEDAQKEIKNISYDLIQKRRTAMKNKAKLFKPKATYVIVGICIFMFVISSFLTGALSNTDIQNTQVTVAILLGALFKEFVVIANEYWRLFTCGFLHVNMIHLVMNMFALISLGSFFEKHYGVKKMLIILFSSIIGGSIFVFLGGDNGVSLGISGGLYGLMASMIVHLWYTGLLKHPHIRNQIISLILINVIITFMPGISILGHVGGFFTGLLMSITLINDKHYKTFIRNGKISLIIGAIVLMYGVVATRSFYPEYLGNDLEVIQAARKLNISWYADYLQEKVTNYYINK